jgi:hypothetical protein
MILYCLISFGFSLLGLVLPDRTIPPNPVHSFTLQEISGHFLWGLVGAAATLNLRYVILGGAFAVLIDVDHLIALLQLETVSRMAHSISFGVISVVIMMIILGRKNYLQGALVAGALLSHLSYDTFAQDFAVFPFFTPIYNKMVALPHGDWLVFEIAAVGIVVLATIFTRKSEQKYSKARLIE